MLRKPPKRTEALVAANRSNSQLSTGPRTALGKVYSRKVALKHWGRAETIRLVQAGVVSGSETGFGSGRGLPEAGTSAT